MSFPIPKRLAATCSSKPDRIAWLERLPDVVDRLAERWSLTIGPPYDSDEVSCAWVAQVTRMDGSPAVLKLGMPHMEARDEMHALRYWDGDPGVYLYDSDEDLNAMLMERCEPGTVLRTLPEPEQDVIIAGLMRRLWRVPDEPHPFRPISELKPTWTEAQLSDPEQRLDPKLIREGLQLFDELLDTSPEPVLLATDLHAGNALQAEREPWLVIDPKPFIGDPAYDATQHLFNCDKRLLADTDRTIKSFADLLGLDHNRIRQWLFARATTESWDDWTGVTEIVRVLKV